MMKTLQDTDKKNPFRVPDNYFEDVNRKIISSLPEELPQIRQKGLFVRIKPFLAVAASVALLIAISFTGLKLFRGEGKDSIISGISIQELSDAYLYELDLQSFEESFAPTIQEMNLPDVSKTEIIEYLISENIGLSEIFENL